MGISLGSNLASLRGQRELNKIGSQLGKIYERLSSGQRINGAADDAAGLAIADSLRSDARIFSQALRNLGDGQSLISIAESGLSELQSIITRIRELAVQSANGTFGSEQRKVIDKEAQALSHEYTRIVKSVSFNDRLLYSPDFGTLALQAGRKSTDVLASDLGGSVGDGTFGGSTQYTTGNDTRALAFGDLNGDGRIDLVTAQYSNDSVLVFFGSGAGSFNTPQSYALSNGTYDIELGDFNGDGYLDIASANAPDDRVDILLNSGSGSFGPAMSFSAGNDPRGIALGDLNGDGHLDVATNNSTGSDITVMLGRGDGTLSGPITRSLVGGFSIALADVNGDEILDAIAGRDAKVFLGLGNGSFGAGVIYGAVLEGDSVGVADVNGDGNLDIVTAEYAAGQIGVLLGAGNGTFGSAQIFSGLTAPQDIALGDLNGDGNVDVITANKTSNAAEVQLGAGDGTFGAPVRYTVGTNPRAVGLADLNGDGALDVAAANDDSQNVSILIANTHSGIGPLLPFSLRTRADALQALGPLEHASQRLSLQAATIGAFSSRIEAATGYVRGAHENFTAAESRIRDADIAHDAAELARLQILQQAAQAILAQANQQPALSLALLS